MRKILILAVLSLLLLNQPVWAKTHDLSKKTGPSKHHSARKNAKKISKKEKGKKGSKGSKNGKDGEFKVESELGKNDVTFSFNGKEEKASKK